MVLENLLDFSVSLTPMTKSSEYHVVLVAELESHQTLLMVSWTKTNFHQTQKLALLASFIAGKVLELFLF